MADKLWSPVPAGKQGTGRLFDGPLQPPPIVARWQRLKAAASRAAAWAVQVVLHRKKDLHARTHAHTHTHALAAMRRLETTVKVLLS